MENLIDVLRKYVMSVEKNFLLWEGLAKKATKPMSEIEILTDQLIAVSSTTSNFPLCEQFPDLSSQVLYQIFMALEKELKLINCFVQEVEENTDCLCKLALQIEHMSLCSENVPPSLSLSMILEFICDSTQYFKALYATLKITLLSLDFRDRSSIKNLRNACFEHEDLKAQFQCCRQIGKNIVFTIDSVLQ